MVNCLKVCAGIFGPLTWILQIVALVTQFWVTGTNTQAGFFMRCSSLIICVVPTNQHAMIWAAAACVGLGLGATGLGILLGWGSCCCCGRKVGVAIASGVFYILGAFCTLVGCILFAAKMGDEFPGMKLGASFIIAIIAMLGSIMCAIFIIIGGKKEANAPQMVMVAPQVMMQPQQGMQQQGY